MTPDDLFGALAPPPIERSAEFSEDGQMRWALTRRLGPGPVALMIGHNPSTASHDRDDPTSLWWIKFCRHHGFGGYVAANLYPVVSSDVSACRRWLDQRGEAYGPMRKALDENFVRLQELARASGAIFACWGAIAQDPVWIDQVAAALLECGTGPIYCFGTTNAGAPKHPMARGKHRMEPSAPPLVWRAR